MELIKQNNYIYITKTKKSEIIKIDFASCGEPTQTLEKFYKAQTQKPDILINGGFFSMSTGKPTMDYIDEHEVKAANANLIYGFGITDGGELKYANKNEQAWKDFISAYPTLLVDGAKVPITIASEINYKARRTIIGYNKDYIFTISIDSPGATFNEAANIALNLGCTHAINLDGGGSTRLLYQGKAYAVSSYNRPVDNVVAIYKKPTLYRVQLGAFSSQTNAKNFCKEIQGLGENYKNAFIKYKTPYYKVQVGAFSIKQNADNMMKDLQNKGYNAFIVEEE